jgi:hypothetical protein
MFELRYALYVRGRTDEDVRNVSFLTTEKTH